MPTDAQRRQQSSAHHAEVQGLNERIALLEQQLAEARKDAARYRHAKAFDTDFAICEWDGTNCEWAPVDDDTSIDAAITSTQEQT